MVRKIRVFSLIILVILLIPTGYSFAGSSLAEKANADSILPLNSNDYSAMIKGEVFSLGDKWDEIKKNNAGKELSSSYVGEVTIQDASYKFFQHNYSGYSIFSSNIYYNKVGRDVDDYIVSQISFNNASTIKTYRGIQVGDSLKSVMRKYGSGKEDNTDNEKWIDYQLGEKVYPFR